MMLILNELNKFLFQLSKAISILLALFVSISCEKTTSYDYQVVDSDIIIKMNEELGNPSRTFKLDLWTEKSYPCFNYSIITNSKSTLNKIIVDIIGIYAPDICAKTIGPARTTIQFENLQNQNYIIEFRIGDNISTGNLICASNEFKLIMNELRQIKIDGTLLKRIPNNTIWGTIGYQSATTIDKVNDFIESLQEIGASELFLENGNYNYFEIEENKIKEPLNSGYWFTKSFVFGFTEDKNTVKTIVKDYGRNYGDLMSISVYGDRGEEYLSWILKNE